MTRRNEHRSFLSELAHMIENGIDRYGLSGVLLEVGNICMYKAELIRESHDSPIRAKRWERAGEKCHSTAESPAIQAVETN